ncbi:MAG: hypothetical protein AABW99_03685 [archaeon]
MAVARKRKLPQIYATTVETRKPFQVLFSSVPKGKTRYLFNKGLHQVVEAWVHDHPGQQLPSREIAKRYGASQSHVIYLAEQVERANKLPSRKRGGVRLRIPENVRNEIKNFVVARKSKGSVNLAQLYEYVARKTRLVVSPVSITDEIARVAKEGGFRVGVKWNGMQGTKILQIIRWLKGKGITASPAFKIFNVATGTRKPVREPEWHRQAA